MIFLSDLPETVGRVARYAAQVLPGQNAQQIELGVQRAREFLTREMAGWVATEQPEPGRITRLAVEFVPDDGWTPPEFPGVRRMEIVQAPAAPISLEARLRAAIASNANDIEALVAAILQEVKP